MRKIGSVSLSHVGNVRLYCTDQRDVFDKNIRMGGLPMGIDSLLYSKGDTTILAIRTEWRNGKERRKDIKGSRHGGQERARRDDCKAKQMKNLAGRMQSKAVMPPSQKRQVLQQIKGYNLTYNNDPRGKLSKGLIQRLKFPGKLIHDCSFFHSRSVSGCDGIPKRAILRQQQHDDNDDANTSNDMRRLYYNHANNNPPLLAIKEYIL